MKHKRGDQSLKKSERLLKSREFDLFKSADEARRRIGTKSVTLLEKPSDSTRLGIVVSKARGSVARNSYKRLVREFFRKNKSAFCGRDILAIIRDLPTLHGLERHKHMKRVREDLYSALLKK